MTTDQMPDFDFASGSKESQAVEDADRPAFGRTEPKDLRWDDENGMTHLLRFLDDDRRGPADNRPNLWKGIKIHNYSATVSKPSEFKGKKWPPGMPATCRYAQAFKGYFPNCIPCDQELTNPNNSQPDVAKQRMFARVVLRERVLWTGDEPEYTKGTAAYDKRDDAWRESHLNKLRTYRDKTETVSEIIDGKQTGRKIEVPVIRMVNQSRYLFFKHMVSEAQGQLDEGEEYTVLDRDFYITKTGKERQTEFSIRAAKGSDQLKGSTETVTIDGEEVSLRGVKWDVNDPRVYAYYDQFVFWTLQQFFIDRAVDSWHEKWFKPGGFAKHDNQAEDNKAKTAKKSEPKKGPQPAPEDEEQDLSGVDDEEPKEQARERQGASTKAEEQTSDDDETDLSEDDNSGPPPSKTQNWRDMLDAGERPATERTDSSGVEDELDDEYQKA